MRNVPKAIFAASIGIASIAAVLIQPTPVAALSQIGEDMGKCQQKAHFKDKMCACKDSACAQKVHSPAAAKTVAPEVVQQKWEVEISRKNK
jgi:hypothetical protein